MVPPPHWLQHQHQPHRLAVGPTRRTVERPAALPHEEATPAYEGFFHLVLLDDDEHSYAYVIEMLGKIFGYGHGKAFALASIVDSEGRVTVETASHEQVTRHQSQVHAYGADPRIPRCKGSMSAIVEPATSGSA